MAIYLTPRAGNAGLLNNPLSGTQSAPSAAVQDGLAATSVTAVNAGLLSQGGVFERQRGNLLGQAKVSELGLQAMMAQVIIALRAILLTLAAQGVPQQSIDEFQVADLLTRAANLDPGTTGVAFDSTTLQ